MLIESVHDGQLITLGCVLALGFPIHTYRFMMSLHPYVRQHLKIDRLVCKKLLEHVLQIKPHVRMMTFGTAYDCHQSSGSLPRLHIADKEPVLAAEGDLAHQLLDTVVIDWNATVPCVHGQGFPVVANVTKGSSQIRFRKDLGLSHTNLKTTSVKLGQRMIADRVAVLY